MPGRVPMCQARGGRGAVAPLQALQGKRRDSGLGHAHKKNPNPGSPSATTEPHRLVPGLPPVPWSFHLSGAHPEGVGAPRVLPDPGHKLSSAQLGMGMKG